MNNIPRHNPESLPEVQADALDAHDTPAIREGDAWNYEFDATQQSNSPMHTKQGASVSVQDDASLVSPLSVTDGTDASSTIQAVSLPADDADLIEKEWVVKAKDIVRRTKDDPKLQSKELGDLKVTYVNSRFNKTLPSSDKAA